MIQIYLFGPSPFVDSLLSLSDMHAYVKGVGVEMEDDDPKLYQTLLSSLEEVLTSSKNRASSRSSTVSHNAEEDSVVVLTPRFGDRFSTIALSIPYDSLYVVAGVNVEMLCCLTKLSPPLRAQITTLAPPDAPTAQTVDPAHLSLDQMSDDEDLKAGSVTPKHKRSTGSNSSTSSTPSEDDSSQSESVENGTLISPPSANSDPEATGTSHKRRSDWSVVTLCELLSVRGQDGIVFLNSRLRAEDDESNIDLSVLETEYY